PPVPCLADDGIDGLARMLDGPFLDAGIDMADRVCVGDANRAAHDAEILHVSEASHLTITIQVEIAAIDRLQILMAAREDDCNTGSHRALAHDERSFAGNQRCLTYLDAWDVGDRIERTGHAFKRN